MHSVHNSIAVISASGRWEKIWHNESGITVQLITGLDTKGRKVDQMFKKILGIILIHCRIVFFRNSYQNNFCGYSKGKIRSERSCLCSRRSSSCRERRKTVIVCGTLELTEPSYDDELKLRSTAFASLQTDYAPRQKHLQFKTNLEEFN